MLRKFYVKFEKAGISLSGRRPFARKLWKSEIVPYKVPTRLGLDAQRKFCENFIMRIFANEHHS